MAAPPEQTEFPAREPDRGTQPWPIRVINLDRASGRMARMAAMLEARALAWERRAAIDGGALAPAERAALTRGADLRRYKRALTPGEIGCYLSHIALWAEIARGPDPVVVVLEDDVELGPEAARDLRALAAGPPDWDLLKICYGQSAPEPALAPRATALRKLPAATMGYAITRPAAARLAELRFPLSRPVDLDLRFWWEHGLAVKVAVPAVGWARSGSVEDSSIEPERSGGRSVASVAGLARHFRYQFQRRIGALRAGRRPPETRQLDDPGPRAVTLEPFLREILERR